MAAWTSFTRLSVKTAHFLFVFIAVAQLLQSPLSKGHQHLARKGSELQVASEFARPAVSSEGYRRSKPPQSRWSQQRGGYFVWLFWHTNLP